MSVILKWKKVKTRKPHKCFGCSNIYPKETEMISASYADGGTAFSGYWCKVCVEYMERYFKDGEGISQGEIYDNDKEAWENLKLENEGEKNA